MLAAAKALFVLTVGGGLWQGRQGAERQGRAREAVDAALAQIPGLRREGRWPEAEAVLAQGRSRLDEAGSDDLRRRLARAGADLRLAAALERIRLTPSIEASRLDYRGMADAYARTFEDAGLDVRGDEGAVAARIGASELRPQLVMALDHWAYVADALEDRPSMARLLRLARRAAADPQWGDRFRDPALWEDDAALRHLAEESEQRLAGAAAESGPPTPLLTLLAKKLGQQDGKADPLLRAAQERRPDDFWLNYALGEALRERKPAEAVGFYRAALATRPTVAAVHLEVGAALGRLGQGDEAIRACRKAVELEPMQDQYHYFLGMCLQDEGRLDEAVAEYRRVIELDPKWSGSHHQLGMCWKAMGRLDEAIAEFRRAIELDPEGTPAHSGLGMCWQAMGRLDEAMAEYRRAIQLDSKLAVAHHTLGMCLQARDELDQAMAEYRRAIQIDSKLAVSHHALGECLQARDEAQPRRSPNSAAPLELEPKPGIWHESLVEAACSGRPLRRGPHRRPPRPRRDPGRGVWPTGLAGEVAAVRADARPRHPAAGAPPGEGAARRGRIAGVGPLVPGLRPAACRRRPVRRSLRRPTGPGRRPGQRPSLRRRPRRRPRRQRELKRRRGSASQAAGLRPGRRSDWLRADWTWGQTARRQVAGLGAHDLAGEARPGRRPGPGDAGEVARRRAPGVATPLGGH